MKSKKLKEKLHEIETQNFTGSHSSSKEKKKTKVVAEEPQKRKSKHNGRKKIGAILNVSSDKSNKQGSIVRKRARYTDMYNDIESQFSVMERADRVLARIPSDAPKFVKCMLPSNVSYGFWLHLSRKFCRMYLPKHDTTVVLVDEWGNEYKTSYLIERNGLSAGWKSFSASHKLLKGDILIFVLVEPCKLKVHIVRVYGLDVIDAAICLMDLSARRRGTKPDLVKQEKKKHRKMKVESFVLVSKGKNSPNSVVEAIWP